MCFSHCQRDVKSYPFASISGMIFYMWNVLFPLSTRCYVISSRIDIRYDFYVCGMCFSHCQRKYAKGRFLLATRYETISSSTYDYYTVRPAMYIGKPDFCIIKRDPIEVLSRSDRGPKEHTHPFSQPFSVTRVTAKKEDPAAASSRQKPAAVGTSQQEQAEASRSRQKPAGAGTSQQQAAKAIRSQQKPAAAATAAAGRI